MNKEELKNQIIELKENCKKLAEDYRERYNQDNEDRIALNMFYHNVISYNDYESVLALIENRNSVIMCFSAPPVLTEETVEINLKHIADLEKENAELKADNDARKFAMAMSEKVEKQLRKENAELKGEADSVLDNWCKGDAPCPHLKKRDEQLTKARGLLRAWFQYCIDTKGKTPLQIETAQFLKEVEK